MSAKVVVCVLTPWNTTIPIFFRVIVLFVPVTAPAMMEEMMAMMMMEEDSIAPSRAVWWKIILFTGVATNVYECPTDVTGVLECQS